MPVSLPNTTTADKYPAGSGGAQLGVGDVFASGFFVVANAAVAAQFLQGPQGQQRWSPELFLAPSTYPISGTPANPLGGIRFRSAVAGTPGQVFGVLYYPNDATLQAGAEFTATVSAAGNIVSAVPAIGWVMQTALLALTNAFQSVPGCSLGFTVTGSNASILIASTWDFEQTVAGGAPGLGQTLLDGIAVGPLAVFSPSGVERYTIAQSVGVIPVAAGAHTITLSAAKSAAGGTMNLEPNTTLSYVLIDK